MKSVTLPTEWSPGFHVISLTGKPMCLLWPYLLGGIQCSMDLSLVSTRVCCDFAHSVELSNSWTSPTEKSPSFLCPACLPASCSCPEQCSRTLLSEFFAALLGCCGSLFLWHCVCIFYDGTCFPPHPSDFLTRLQSLAADTWTDTHSDDLSSGPAVISGTLSMVRALTASLD